MKRERQTDRQTERYGQRHGEGKRATEREKIHNLERQVTQEVLTLLSNIFFDLISYKLFLKFRESTKEQKIYKSSYTQFKNKRENNVYKTQKTEKIGSRTNDIFSAYDLFKFRGEQYILTAKPEQYTADSKKCEN